MLQNRHPFVIFALTKLVCWGSSRSRSPVYAPDEHEKKAKGTQNIVIAVMEKRTKMMTSFGHAMGGNAKQEDTYIRNVRFKVMLRTLIRGSVYGASDVVPN